MSLISPSTTVFIFFHDPRYERIWVADTELVRNKRGELVLNPILDSEARYAKPMRYDLAVIAGRRFNTEGVINSSIYQACFALSASNSAEEIASAPPPQVPDKDGRVDMVYKGVVARPFIPRGWCVHLFDGKMQLESIRGETVEEAVDKVIERNLFKFAEKHEQPEPEPAPSAPKNNYGGARMRPGSLR